MLKTIILKDKKTNKQYKFDMYMENDLKPLMQHQVVKGFNMNRLEIEYDYDTDSEQIKNSQNMLFRELG